MKENVKIRIIEHEALTALDLKRNLQQVGYQVCEPVASGEKASFKVKEAWPDVVLMDIRLAGVKGKRETFPIIIWTNV